MSHFSFYRRIQLSFLLFILLPFIFVTLWSYSSIKQNVTDKITRSNEDVLTVISDALSKTIDHISFASVYLSPSSDTNVTESLRFLKNVSNFSDSTVYKHQKQLKSMIHILTIQSMDADLKLFVLNARQRFLAGNLEQPLFSEMVDRQFTSSLKLDESEHTLLQWFRVPASDASPAYYYAAKIIIDHRNQEKLATMFVGIPETYFEELFHLSGGSGSLKLLDRDGNLIASSGNPVESDHVLASRRTIPKTGWNLVYESPRMEITGQIYREFQMTLYISGSFFAVFLVLSLFWAKRLNKPILQLRGKAKQYVAGNRNVRMPVKGKDEVALLSTVFNQMLEDIDHLLLQMERDQEEKRSLELRALAEQIRPHFLLNTLNSIKVNLIMAGDRDHAGMLDSLMILLRAYVHPDKPVGLEEEQRLLEGYIRIMQVRNRMDISFRCELAEETKNLLLPRMLLQPIVENAIIHGFAERPERAEIQLSAQRRGDLLVIAISNNGRGMPAERLNALNLRLQGPTWTESGREGVGLVNTLKRLRHYYGPKARMTAEPRWEGGLCFVLEIPSEKLKEKESEPDVQSDAD